MASNTDERDKELDELEKELRDDPFIAKPDEIKVGDGSICFLDKERMCGGECTAFNWQADPRQSPNQCLILAYGGQVASGALVEVARARQERRAQEDEQRRKAASAEVPKP